KPTKRPASPASPSSPSKSPSTRSLPAPSSPNVRPVREISRYFADASRSTAPRRRQAADDPTLAVLSRDANVRPPQLRHGLRFADVVVEPSAIDSMMLALVVHRDHLVLPAEVEHRHEGPDPAVNRV